MKTLLKLIILMSVCAISAQNGIYISITQDVKHATYDEDAFRLNLLTRLKLEGKQKSIGYVTIYPEFEYADLNTAPYTRISFNGGYTFNTLLKNFETGAYIGWGLIQRGDSVSYRSWGILGDVSYIMSNRFKLTSALQFVKRGDLKYKYGTKGLKPSVFFGIEFKITK